MISQEESYAEVERLTKERDMAIHLASVSAYRLGAAESRLMAVIAALRGMASDYCSECSSLARSALAGLDGEEAIDAATSHSH